MKSFTSTLIAVAGFAAIASAAPSRKRDVDTVDVTFFGASPDVNTYATVPLDGVTSIYVDTPFSVSSVSYDVEGVECWLTGIDSDKGQAAASVIANGGQVGPPQVIISIICDYVY